MFKPVAFREYPYHFTVLTIFRLWHTTRSKGTNILVYTRIYLMNSPVFSTRTYGDALRALCSAGQP